jgi:hypothetical protein
MIEVNMSVKLILLMIEVDFWVMRMKRDMRGRERRRRPLLARASGLPSLVKIIPAAMASRKKISEKEREDLVNDSDLVARILIKKARPKMSPMDRTINCLDWLKRLGARVQKKREAKITRQVVSMRMKRVVI